VVIPANTGPDVPSLLVMLLTFKPGKEDDDEDEDEEDDEGEGEEYDMMTF